MLSGLSGIVGDGLASVSKQVKDAAEDLKDAAEAAGEALEDVTEDLGEVGSSTTGKIAAKVAATAAATKPLSAGGKIAAKVAATVAADVEAGKERLSSADQSGLRRAAGQTLSGSRALDEAPPNLETEKKKREELAKKMEYEANKEANKSQEPAESAADRLAQKELDEVKEKVEKMRVGTMADMVKNVVISVKDLKATCRTMYLTTTQIADLDTFSWSRMHQELDLGDPKMVIRLCPSRFGHTYYEGKGSGPASAGRFPTKELPELYFDEDDDFKGVNTSELTEHQLLLLAKEILGLARKTQALVIGNELCALTEAFIKVAFPEQRQLGEKCPFRVLVFANCFNLEMKARDRNSVVYPVKQKFKVGWESSKFPAALREFKGDDEAYWPSADLPCGHYALVLFECIRAGPNGTKQITESSANMFQNAFVMSLVNVPVIGIATYGCKRYEQLNVLADHVRSSFPLLMVDSRLRKRQVPDDAFLAKQKEAGDSAPYMSWARQELDRFAAKLHKAGRMDQHLMSVVAFVKEVLELKEESLAENNDQHSTDAQRNMWLFKAIKTARRKPTDHTTERPQSGDEGARDKRALATEVVAGATLVMRYVGEQAEWEVKQRHARLEVGMEEIRMATGWKDLNTKLEAHWLKLRGCCFHFHDPVREFIKDNPGLPLKLYENQEQKWSRGKLQLLVDMQMVKQGGEDMASQFEHGKEVMMKFLRVQADKSMARDINLTAQVLCTDKAAHDNWLNLITILEGGCVKACSLHDKDECRRLLEDMAQIDYLPRESSLEALVLIRRAWTLRDIYQSHAKYYKGIAKATYLVFLMMGLAVISVTVLDRLAEEPYNQGYDFTGNSAQVTLLVSSLISSLLSALTTLIQPQRKWFGLKGGSLMLESEIWKFRARMGKYARDSSTGALGRDVCEREAALVFAKVIMDVQNKVQQSATGMKRTAFFANVTSMNDAFKQVTLEECHKEFSSKERQPFKQHALHGQHQVGKFIDPKAAPKDGEDNFHTPVLAEDYINWRLIPLRDFYQMRIPVYAKRRFIFKVLLLFFSILNGLIAGWSAIGLPWTAFFAACTAAITAWTEFIGYESKLDRYASVAGALEDTLTNWQSLSDVEKASMNSVQDLVLGTESLVTSEHSAWMSDAEQVAEQQEAKAAKKKDRQAQEDGSGGHKKEADKTL